MYSKLVFDDGDGEQKVSEKKTENIKDSKREANVARGLVCREMRG